VVCEGQLCEKAHKCYTEDFDESMIAYMRQQRIGEMAWEAVSTEWFHSANFNRVSPEELDIDSEDDMDEQWIAEDNCKLLDQFTDVGQADKDFMKLWNGFSIQEKLISDWEIGGALVEFVRQHSAVLYKELRPRFKMHLVTLWEHGVISVQQVESLTQLLTAMATGQDVPKEFATPPGLHWRQHHRNQTIRAQKILPTRAEARLLAREDSRESVNGVYGDLSPEAMMSQNGIAIRENGHNNSPLSDFPSQPPPPSRVRKAETLVAAEEEVLDPHKRRTKRQRQASNKLAVALQTTSDAQMLRSVLRNSVLDC